MSYTTIDPTDRKAVIWLQSALYELMNGIHGLGVDVGRMTQLTDKAIQIYQMKRNLPMTGKPDEATLQRINAELQERGITL